jgi:cyclic beta-1,2-glucan synthetase
MNKLIRINKSEPFTSFEEPIRSEIFSAARLEIHGESLARAQKNIAASGSGKKIGRRVSENGRVLEASYVTLLDAVANKRAITPAAEWLIDNFHLVRTQLSDIHHHLTPKFYYELPKLGVGPLKGYPRVYGIAWAFVAHTDSRFDPDLFKRFLISYQSVQPLTIGELWAVPLTLRVVLIENLRRLTESVAASQKSRFTADQIANEILGLTDTQVRPIEQIIKDFETRPLVAGFDVQMLQRLRFQDVKVNPVLEWLDERFKKENRQADEVVASEHASQTGANVSVRNIITSFRLISSFDWQDFFESVSLVDEILGQHLLYSTMDFITRDRYRHGLEDLARYSALSELEVAKLVVAKAVGTDATGNSPNWGETKVSPDSDARDPGYFLIGMGRRNFETEIVFKAPLRTRVLRLYLDHPTTLYLTAIATFVAALLFFLLRSASSSSASLFTLALLTFFGAFPASLIAIAVINRITIALIGPRHLARLSLRDGIPTELKTCVVVPTMIGDEAKLDYQLEQLEIHFLSNSAGSLHFALLTDWNDSSSEISSRDLKLTTALHHKLEALNEKYGPLGDGSPRFFVFHRKRLFNKAEGKWMGWERKRGKLHELNRLLRGESNTSFISIGNKPLRVPENVKYVITLDADTKLPNGSAIRLVGTIAHPLNRARFNVNRDRVIGGFGILQPRITPKLPRQNEATIYQRLSTGTCGIDPYASAISDVYQDLFGEGSYAGKGIYDIDAFEVSLKDRIPENSLLSHDLFEGCFARCGFLSDVELYEDFPSHTGVADARTHRWTRGDWQLLPWILGFRGRGLTPINRWKMIDNLRRSLVPATSLAMLIMILADRSIPLMPWLTLLFLSLEISAALQFLIDMVPIRRNTSFAQHYTLTFHDFTHEAGRSLQALILMANQSWLLMDAILRALYRLCISRRMVLEWATAAQTQLSSNYEAKTFFRKMIGGVGLAFAGLLIIYVGDIDRLQIYLPFFALWVLSPLIALRLSLPPRANINYLLEPKDIQLLNVTARKIWRFFDTFVTATDHHLPPDNFQEDPVPVVAHRSSPTNFGLYLLSVLAARDFGWIGTVEMADRLDLTLKSIQSLPRFQGHFYNWYETSEARALEPRYLSSVDNGNLAGHLLAVAQGCDEALKQNVIPSGFNRGILQTLLILETSFSALVTSDAESHQLVAPMGAALEKIASLLLTPDHMIFSRDVHWNQLREIADHLVDTAMTLATGVTNLDSTDVLAWAQAIKKDIESSAQDFNDLVSWTEFARTGLITAEPLTNVEREWNDRIWPSMYKRLEIVLPLEKIPEHCEFLRNDILNYQKDSKFQNATRLQNWLGQLAKSLEKSSVSSRQAAEKMRENRRLCYQLFSEMDFGLLYDPARKLFSIGFRVAENQLDNSYYDLLASEARLTSFVAIAKGDVPPSHWFQLDRPLTLINQQAALVSWSGSMFEYLMPSLVMNAPFGSLLDKTCQLTSKRQIQYGVERNIPWGISESAYNKRDLQLTYQYSNFGVPDLGLKRGLRLDLVVAPYATLLAAMYDAVSAVENLRSLQKLGAEGPYGFYESVDFTPSRLPSGKTAAVVKTYMAHHQGMSLIAIANVFKNGIMRDRFHANPIIKAAELLLQEHTPRNVGITKPNEESIQIELVKEEVEHASRRYHSVHRTIPTTQLLANTEYSVMVTSAGSGYSHFRNLSVNRWHEDVTKDCFGSYLYLKDCRGEENAVWSAAFQPTCVKSEFYEATFSDDRAIFTREDHRIRSQLEIFVSPEDNVEIRRLSLCNHSSSRREIEITSFFETVLASPIADSAHPAFSNLFVQTEYLSEHCALLATRRPRSAADSPIWMGHVILTDRHSTGEIEYETDRAQFIGRGKTARTAHAVFGNERLSNTVGPVLDPIMSLRSRIRIDPDETSRIAFATVIADTREEVIRLVDKFRDVAAIERASDLAWTQTQVKLHHLNIEPDEVHLFQKLTSKLLFSDSALRPSSERIKLNKKDVTGLWSHGISGDNPILLVRIDDIEERGLIRQLLKAHEYIGSRHMKVDLVILNDKANSYTQDLQNALLALVQGATARAGSSSTGLKGKVFVLRSDLISVEDRLLLGASARVSLSGRQGSLSDQVRRMRTTIKTKKTETRKFFEKRFLPQFSKPIPELEFFNGLGGFSKANSEYIVVLNNGQTTPAPWLNVIANSKFGFQVSESGSGFTWSLNSRENQITAWSNDPVSDPCTEAFYVRDFGNGAVWSPTALPIRINDATYVAKHGQGYSRFETAIQGIHSELTQFVPVHDSIKISRLKLENQTKSSRHLQITSYVEWVLGFNRETMAPMTITEVDTTTGAIFASNTRSNEYGSRISFATFSSSNKAYTCDRTEFIGRNGNLESPVGVSAVAGLSGRVGGGLDPCAALQTEIEMKPGDTTEVVFFLGQAETRAEAQELILKYKAMDLDHAFAQTNQDWDTKLNQIQVETPDRAMDLVLNKWLLYQTMVCRYWARSAFYQSGGAFGFRDQLQDVMALVTSQPQITRAHILRAASRQFIEGDVQHWWHPPKGRGVRTHFSDDLLWLPFAVSHYLSVTDDASILDEQMSFLEGPPLKRGQEDSYFTPTVSAGDATLFEHCARTIDKALPVGAHGLPLMGTGDWNDGMNHVGHEGKGESVWLAWFLYINLVEFSKVAERMGAQDRAKNWAVHAAQLKDAVEKHAWDGQWYRRAYFDDGTPLGTSTADECKIDSLTQSWAVISRAANPDRSIQAMKSVDRELVKANDQLILLFTPPFDRTTLDPGYIKGYLPGVRENGGQYTHAAVWCVIAQALLGNGERAVELFSMLNPVNHGDTVESIQRYKVEPYVMAADVYSVAPHVGRGGWTWYTGAAGWMYRAGIEFILGIRREGSHLVIDPCIPPAWKEFKIHYRHGKSKYHIHVLNPYGYSKGVAYLTIDGQSVFKSDRIPLEDSAGEHHVVVTMGR